MNVYLFFYVVVEFDTWETEIKYFLNNVHVSSLLSSELEDISFVFHTLDCKL